MQLEIQELYENFADKENIKLLDAKKKISDADLENIDFELLTKYALKNNDTALLKYISTLSAKTQITRLEFLNLEIQKTLSKLFHQEQTSLYEYLLDTYKDSYFRGIYNIQTYFQIGYDFIKPNDEVIKIAITKDWAKSNYSKRLWGHRYKLADELSEHINVSLIQGKSIDEMAKKIAKDMNVSLNNATRLVRTETNYIHNQATLDTYINYAGIEEYKYLATLDFRTSTICQELDGRVFDVKDAKAGINFPPMHPNCRSTTIPYFKGDPVGERIARASDGKTYYVPDDMTYKDWFNSLSEDEKGKMKLNLKKHQNLFQDIKQFENYKSILGKDAPNTIEKFQNIKYDNKEEWNKLKLKYKQSPNRIIQSGGRLTKGSCDWVIGRDDEAEDYYNKIRNIKTDIKEISKNTGWSEASIEKIKNHVFYNKHILREGNISLLNADYNMAVAWQRLINGDYEDRDILLLKHEYLESIIENRYKISNEEAHVITTKTHDWYGQLIKEKGKYEEDDCLNDIIRKKPGLFDL